MKHLIKNVFALLRPNWPAVLFVFFAIAVQMSFRLALPMSFQLVFDRAIPNQDARFFLNLVTVLVIWWLVQALFSVAQDIQASKVGMKAVNRLRIDMYRTLHFLPTENRIQSGELLSRFSGDLAAVEKVVIHAFYIFIFSAFNVIASLILLFVIDWRLALLTLSGMVLSAIAPKRVARKAEKASYERKGQDGTVSAFVQETLGTLNVIHSFNLWRFRQKEFAAEIDALDAKAQRANKLAALVNRLGSQSATLLQVAIVALGGYLVIRGELTVGTLVAFLALLQNMVGGISHLSAVLPDMFQGVGAMKRVQEFLATDHLDLDDTEKPALPRLKQSLTFDHVTFRYRDGKTAVDDLSFQIKPGQSVAIVGPSGSGKSTLLKLLLRFHDPHHGAILWDGVDLRDTAKASLRDQVSVVPQESVLFSTSLRDNIRMGRLEASDDEIVAAARKAEIHQSIMAMPEGIETRVGERGGQLSGGQRQRVAIARALLRDPAVLILDEATSALDPGKEKAVMDTIRKIAEDRTLISITHRLHTVTQADLILVLSRGRLVQRGTHEELVDQDGLYAELWRKQTGFTLSHDGFRAECEPHRLKQIPLFAELDLEPLRQIAELLVSEYYPKDRTLFEKGDYGDKFYIIVNGQVEVSTDDAEVVLDSGAFFGELALMDDAVRSASIRTRLPTLFLTLSKRHFEGLLDAHPQVRTLIERTAKTRRVTET